jgi:hypothetical protein
MLLFESVARSHGVARVPPLLERLRSLKKLLPVGIAVFGIVGLVLSYVPDFWCARRLETAHETILYYFAQNLGEPALCDRISWAAYRRHSILFAGGGASFWRSDCYEQVAQIRHDADLCWKVRPLVDLDPLSAGYSAIACRRRTRAGYRSVIALPDDVLIRTFGRLGYDIDEMGREIGAGPAVRWQDVYRRLESDSAALARAQQLLARPDPVLAAEDRSYLAHLAAIGTADPRWCAAIPPAITIGQVVASFRDWCYFTVAYDSNDTRICSRMTPNARDAKVLAAEAHGVRRDIAEQLGLQADCLRSDQLVGPRAHYAPELPAEEQVARRLFGTLGVVVPSAHDWPAAGKAHYYRNYLFSLWPAKPAVASRDAARATLVARLVALSAEP